VAARVNGVLDDRFGRAPYSASSARSRLTAGRSRAGGSAAWGTPAMS